MKTRRVLLHNNGPVLWPEHLTLDKVLAAKARTQPHIWDTTYQLDPKSPGGAAYKREWWAGGRNRYVYSPAFFEQRGIRRWVSFDTGFETGETNAWTAGVCGEILDTYDLAIRDVEKRHVGFDELPDFIAQFSRAHALDGLLGGVIIEAKASGISAMQTIRASSDRWLADLITPYMPIDSKDERYRSGARWAKLDFIKLPFPSPECPWLYDFTSEFWEAPNSRFLDMTDAATQLIDFLVPSVFEVALDAREAAASIPY